MAEQDPYADDALVEAAPEGMEACPEPKKWYYEAPDEVLEEDSRVEPDVVKCDSLRVSYVDPYARTNDRLTEDVFLDPRDSWCNEDTSILFCTADALTNLQRRLDSEYKYFRGSQKVMDTCRHDYLRELAYLMEECNRVQETYPQFKNDIQGMMDEVKEKQGYLDLKTSSGLEEEEVENIAEKFGTRTEEDEPLVELLEAQDLDRRCEFTLRILLKELRDQTDDLVDERDRLKEILGPLDGAQEKVVEALLAAARGEGASISDLVCFIRDSMKSEQGQQEIEDLVTGRLRTRYEALCENYAEVESRVFKWRETLACMEEREAQLCELNAEVEEVQKKADLKTLKLEQAEQARAAQRAANAQQFRLMLKAMENLGDEDQRKYDEMEAMLARKLAEADKLREEIAQTQESYDAVEERRDGFRKRIDEAEEFCKYAEADLRKAEERLAKSEEREKLLKQEDLELVAQRELLEDEYTAASSVPPKPSEMKKYEAELAETELRNASLRDAEAKVYERERLYTRRCEEATAAWKLVEEERAAEAAARKKAKERPGSRGKRRLLHDDLDLVPYFERYRVADYKRNDRNLNLHTDVRARDRQLQIRQQAQYEKVEKDLQSRLAAMAPEVAQLNLPVAKLPVWFRRPEDLRVRLAGAEITVGHVVRVCEEQQTCTRALSDELRTMGQQLGGFARESFRLHSEARAAYTELAADKAGASFPEEVLTRELTQALATHQARIQKAEEAWSKAEKVCERSAGESEVEAEQAACLTYDKELTVAARELYIVSEQAAVDASGSLAGLAQRCCADLQAVEPQLAAAGAARSTLWPRAMQAAGRLEMEKKVEDGLRSFLRDEAKRKESLDKELKAPHGEAKRALASMRSVSRAGQIQDALGAAVVTAQARDRAEKSSA